MHVFFLMIANLEDPMSLQVTWHKEEKVLKTGQKKQRTRKVNPK